APPVKSRPSRLPEHEFHCMRGLRHEPVAGGHRRGGCLLEPLQELLLTTPLCAERAKLGGHALSQHRENSREASRLNVAQECALGGIQELLAIDEVCVLCPGRLHELEPPAGHRVMVRPAAAALEFTVRSEAPDGNMLCG